MIPVSARRSPVRTSSSSESLESATAYGCVDWYDYDSADAAPLAADATLALLEQGTAEAQIP